MKLRILLLHLPQNPNNVKDHDSMHQPYGLACISGYLKSLGYDVILFDANAEGIEEELLVDFVKEIKPDVIGLTVFSAWLAHTISFLDKIKMYDPSIISVIGGPHPSSEEGVTTLRQNPCIDYAVRGEGEFTLHELLKHIESGLPRLSDINGLVYRKGSEVLENRSRPYIEDLDSMPYPDWDSLPMDKYWAVSSEKKNFANILFSRGCKYDCHFCGQHVSLGKKVRFMSPARIIDEIKLLYYKHNVRELNLSDATFNVDNDWVKTICHELLNFGKKDLVWGCNVRANDVDEETLSLMKEAGCTNVFLGAESGDDGMLRNMGKGITVKMIRDAAYMLKNIGIKVYCSFLLGMPGETRESFRNTMKLARELRKFCHTAFSIASPFPGTKYYAQARKEGFEVEDWKLCDYFGISYVPKGMTKGELSSLYRKAVLSYYTDPIFIYNQIRQMGSWLQFKKTLRLGLRIVTNRRKSVLR